MTATLLDLPIPPVLITLALVAIATGIRIGAQLTERRHRADLIQQAAAIRGEAATRGARR
jgi:hypothetical protein